MKSIYTLTFFSIMMLISLNSCAQKDKSKRPSPPAFVTQKVGTVTLSIDYSQPSVKGRTIGVDLEPKDGEVWRTGANEATVFETDADIKVEGKPLPKGKYGLFSLVHGDEWTIIFNKTWKQWGAFDYKESDDALRIKVKAGKAEPASEKMTFTIDEKGTVQLLWGDRKVSFTVN